MKYYEENSLSGWFLIHFLLWALTNPLIFSFQTEISGMLESLKKKLRELNKTKEQWEETKSYIQVNVCVFHKFTQTSNCTFTLGGTLMRETQISGHINIHVDCCYK